MFLIESAWIIGAGIAAGIPLAIACGRLAKSLLYGLAAQDLKTGAASIAVLAVVAFAAAAIPAWRAACLDPLVALRQE